LRTSRQWPVAIFRTPAQGNRRAWERRSCARHLFVPALSAWSHGGCERAKRPWPKRRLRRPAN